MLFKLRSKFKKYKKPDNSLCGQCKFLTYIEYKADEHNIISFFYCKKKENPIELINNSQDKYKWDIKMNPDTRMNPNNDCRRYEFGRTW